MRLHTGVERADAAEDEFGSKLTQTDQRLYERAAKLVERNARAILDLSSAFMDAWRNAGSPTEFEFPANEIDKILRDHRL